MLEQLLDRKTVIQHTLFVFLISFIYVFVAFFVQNTFYPDQSLAITLLLTILLVPSLHHLIIIEEKIERTGSNKFWKKHKTIIKCYIGAFLGILLGFLAMGAINETTIAYQTQQLEQTHLRPELMSAFKEYSPDMMTAIALISHNVKYMLIAFILSIFYGAGAIFIITFNASFFAAFVLQLYSKWPELAGTLTGVSLLHLLPESTGFIITAIAGATLSRAIIHEKLRGQEFKNVLQNAVKMLIIGLIFVILAGIIETYLTATVFHTLLT